MPRKILKINYDDELNFSLMGMATGLKDYRLAFEMNKALEIDLQRAADHILIVGKNNSQIRYNRFQYFDSIGLTYTLISNKNQSSLMLPELQMIDYLLLLEPPDENTAKEIIISLKKIKTIQAVFKFEIKDLKSRQNLLSETAD
ncbi:MAG: IPExxxVDY family protein [Bacteroidia bacterium]|nr:IPExxxVDY family protein [Bacteroidia bacterium]HQU99867.1 IPExxxVDY family protein [Bacteroidia bacterium]